jgi:hypothetical protein
VQAFCIGLLFDEIRALRREFYDTEGDTRFRRPIFHIMVRGRVGGRGRVRVRGRGRGRWRARARARARATRASGGRSGT